MAEEDKHKDTDRPRPRFSPFSPFPYGSPLTKTNNLQTSFSGSPGQKMLLGTSLHQPTSEPERTVMTPRMKGRELYGGPVIFGSSARKSRLLSAGPYTAAFRSRAVDKAARLERVSVTFPPSLGAGPPPSSLPSTAPSSPHSSPGPASSPPAPLSSSARVILSTLEKLSSGGTPITDARRMPLASPSSSTRVEKRKLLETELNCSLSSSPSRKARLGGGGLALSLAGPPLRKNFSLSLNISSSASSSASFNSMTSTTPQIRSSLKRDVTENQSGFEFEASTDNAIVNSTKSSLKIKSKVTRTHGGTRADLESSAPCPPALPSPTLSSTQLKVDSLPVFNFCNAIKPQAAVISSSKSDITTAKKISPLPSPIPGEVLERNNNSKSPLKRQCETDGERDSPKKIKSPFPQNPSVVPKSSQNLGIIPDKKPASLVTSTTSKTFIFSAPKSVIAETKSQATYAATKKYSFSLPSPVNQTTNAKLSNGTGAISSVPRATSFVPSINLKPSTVTPVESVMGGKKMMPDITNNTLQKNVSSDKLKGSNSNSGLPDVTASTGFGGFLPAKELKTGSVMDILGNKV